MAVLKYLRKEGPVHKCSALSKKVIEQVNELVRQVLMPYENATVGKQRSATRGSYADYTPNRR